MSTDTPTQRLDALFATLTAAHVLDVRIAFSGGGDEGGADTLTLSYADGHTETVTSWWDTDVPWIKDVGQLPHWLYDSFAGDFSVDGELVLDVTARTVTVDATEHEYRAHTVTYDTNEFLEKTRSDAFLDTVATQDTETDAMHAHVASAPSLFSEGE